jgi:hypothetical protein
MTQLHRLLAIAIRDEVSNRKKESQGLCDAMVGFMGWTSMPGTFVESKKRLEDRQSFMLWESSLVLAGTKHNAWYDTSMIFYERRAIGTLSMGRES